MAIDKAMREDDDEDDNNNSEGYGADSSRAPAGYVENDEEALNASNRQVLKRGLLGPRVAGVLGLVSVALLWENYYLPVDLSAFHTRRPLRY